MNTTTQTTVQKTLALGDNELMSIDPQYDPSLMYRRNVNLTDMSRLAVELGKMVKKAIADNTNRKIQ